MATTFIYCASGESGIHLLNPDRKGFSRTVEAHPTRSFFLAAHPRRPILYSVEEEAATVAAFTIAPDGSLQEINHLKTVGTVPCHLGVDPAVRFIVVASYCGGVEIFPLREDGGLKPASDIFQPTGSGPAPQQEAAHPHAVTLVDDLVYVADLGVDRIFVLKINHASLRFTLLPELTQTMAPGAGPRHFVVHPNGRHALSVNELDNTITSFIRDPASGSLTPVANVSTLPPDFKGVSYTAEIGYNSEGETCYASNRGHDSLAVFSVDERTGQLKFRQFIASGGKIAQHFLLDFSGSLLIANTDSDCVAHYRMERGTGVPMERLADIAIKKPMCLLEIPSYSAA